MAGGDMPLTMALNEHIPEASPVSWMERLALSMVRDSLNSALIQVSGGSLCLCVMSWLCFVWNLMIRCEVDFCSWYFVVEFVL